MTSNSIVESTEAAGELVESSEVQTPSMLRDFIELSKPRISVMVLLTVAVAGLVSAPAVANLTTLIHGMIGLLLVSASGCALNQYLERYVDWLMPRTAKRPLPDQRLTSVQVASFGAITFGVGIAYLLALTNWQTALVAGSTWFLYVWVYTPLKPRTWLNTYVGAVAGAMPVLIGSTAIADGLISLNAWLLFTVLYIWQFPHFMAIAWLYRGDYEDGGLKMITIDDPSGKRTAWHANSFAFLLLPLTVFALYPTIVSDGTNWIAGGVVLALGLMAAVWYLVASIRFSGTQNEATARKLFRVSLMYLPIYLVLVSIASSI